MPFRNELIVHAVKLGRLSWTDTKDWFLAAITVLLQVGLLVFSGLVLVATLLLTPVLVTIQALDLALLSMQSKTP